MHKKDDFSWSELQPRFEELCSEVADSWARRGVSGARLWLWFRESDGPRWGGLVLLHHTPNPDLGYQLADPEPVPAGLSRDGARAWIRERAWRLPLLPTSKADADAVRAFEGGA